MVASDVGLEVQSYAASEFDVEAWLARLRDVRLRDVGFDIDGHREEPDDPEDASGILLHPERQTGEKIFVLDVPGKPCSACGYEPGTRMVHWNRCPNKKNEHDEEEKG